MRQLVKSIIHHPRMVRAFAALDVLAILTAQRIRITRRTPRYHVILTTTGHGNIGDQAMFEAYLQNVGGPIVAVIPESGAFDVPDSDIDRVTLVELDKLIYGRGLSHYIDLFRLGRVFQDARSVFVTGADIMDGGYNARLSEMEWTVAIAARACALPTQVLGFSWNGVPVASVVALAQWAGRAGVLMNVRDPLSFERLNQLGIRGIRQSADMVFLLGDADDLDDSGPAISVVRTWGASGKRIALVNCSGLIDAATDLEADYVQVVEHLVAKGCHVMLVPHVIRPDSDDLLVCRRVAQHFPESQVHLVDSLLAPRKVKAMAQLASIIVTGRMHLSVLGLSAGTPSIVLATQGKVEGLMQLFGHPEWNVSPVPGFASEVLPLLDAAIDKRPDLVQASVRVSELARNNFVGEQDEVKAAV